MRSSHLSFANALTGKAPARNRAITNVDTSVLLFCSILPPRGKKVQTSYPTNQAAARAGWAREETILFAAKSPDGSSAMRELACIIKNCSHGTQASSDFRQQSE